MKKIFIFFTFFFIAIVDAQNIVSYAGNSGKEAFYDVTQLSNGTFLIVGYTENLSWFGSAPKTQLSYSGTTPNATGTNRYGFIMQVSENLQTIMHVVHFPQGAVEDVRFIKTNSQPYTTTGDLYISCNTSDTSNNNGGYLLAKLNNNFINGAPNELTWMYAVQALSGPKDYHPWDVTSTGDVYYVMGQAHSTSWSALFCLNNLGQRKIVENWRTHWQLNGSEIKGTPASSLATTSNNPVIYSGIALKGVGRCEFRSWTQADYDLVSPDGNGRTKKGKWPCDFMFNGPCDNAAPTANGPGYNGYRQSNTPVWGGSSLVVDRRNNNLYIGMNMKTVLPDGQPDFEPAVVAMNNTGQLIWWSRLYHEVSANGVPNQSTPDQYVDALAVDYFNNKLVVGARCHGNNVENLWRGNAISTNISATGFQNQFTGTNGNIHLSWLGKLGLADGVLSNATYMGEFVEGSTNYGAALTSPNLNGWPNPNAGWPNLNTTRMARNGLKVGSTGDVCVASVGRRTMTTANAHQQNLNPFNGGTGSWNNFVRVYESNFSVPKYSSLITGVWNTNTGVGGDNTEVFGIYKTNLGIISVGRHNANATTAVANGNPIAVENITPWGNNTPNGESAFIAYYKATNLTNEGDTSLSNTNFEISSNKIQIYPNPAKSSLQFIISNKTTLTNVAYEIYDLAGRNIMWGNISNQTIEIDNLLKGHYILKLNIDGQNYSQQFLKY